MLDGRMGIELKCTNSCRSRLIYGLHNVIRVSELYINFYNLGHFWPQNTSFYAITATKCYIYIYIYIFKY